MHSHNKDNGTNAPLIANIGIKFNCSITGLKMIDLNSCDGKCSNNKVKSCKLREVMLSANKYVVTGVY